MQILEPVTKSENFCGKPDVFDLVNAKNKFSNANTICNSCINMNRDMLFEDKASDILIEYYKIHLKYLLLLIILLK